jgi:exosome complex exonuclease DIS3/RRP44
LLNKFARIFKQNRIDQGALSLASPEVRFKLDVETMNPTDVSVYALKEANSLVEEWMLQANITVSKEGAYPFESFLMACHEISLCQVSIKILKHFN